MWRRRSVARFRVTGQWGQGVRGWVIGVVAGSRAVEGGRVVAVVAVGCVTESLVETVVPLMVGIGVVLSWTWAVARSCPAVATTGTDVGAAAAPTDDPGSYVMFKESVPYSCGKSPKSEDEAPLLFAKSRDGSTVVFT